MTELKSPCKVNLFLDITSKREDGYHLIESLFHTVNLYDILTIEESNSFKVTTSGKYKLNDNEPTFIGEYYQVIYGNGEIYYTK